MLLVNVITCWIWLTSSCRRLYHWFTYMLFIYNAIIGLLVAAMRLLTSFLFSLVLVIRLDILIMKQGLEFWDTGELNQHVL